MQCQIRVPTYKSRMVPIFEPDPIDSLDFAREVSALGAEPVIFLRRVLLDESVAEDVLQAVLLSAFAARMRFQSGTDFRAWIYQFLVHEVANANRRLRKARVRLNPLVDEPEAPSSAAALEAELAYSEIAEDPQALLDRLDERLAAALQSLGEDERGALLLRAIADFSVAEIAHLYSVPQGTIMARLFRARLKLRTMLAEHAGGMQERHP